jgi:clan AA aspartic protease (TIGR02281 family)
VAAGREARNRRDAGEAIGRLEDGVAQLAQSGVVRLELGNAYADGGFLEAAIASYAEAKRLDPSLAFQADAAAERLRGLMSTSGGVEIHFTPGSKAIRTTMRLNDQVPTDVIIDTGASTSVITRKVAERLRLDLRGALEVDVLTAGGRLRAPVGHVRTAAIGNAVVQDLEVVVVDLPDWDGTGGLVGLNFLDRFKTTIDFQRGVLTLSAR